MRYVIGLVIFLLIALIGLYIYFIKVDKLESELKIPQITLENQFEELKSFSDYKGKVLLVDFWFQGCKPCLEEMKFFPELLKKYDSELAIMSISIDPKERTEYLLEQKPKPWNFLVSDNKNWTFY
jgi:peroxiredoxin